jgi:formylglycine-generating enzyme required for sulfatase activity
MGAEICMLRVTGGMRGRFLLVGLLQISMSLPSPALAGLKHLPTPRLGVEPALRRAREAVTCKRQQQFEYCSLGDAESPLVPGAGPFAWNAAERERQPYAKDTTAPFEVFNKKHKAYSVYARSAEARIEGQKEPRRSITHRIPTIQLLDCTTLAEEEVCKGLMCTWEAARCHESTASAGPAAAPKPLSNAEEQALKPGDSFRECDNCPEILVIPAGRFMMGSPANEPQRLSSETQVQVSIAAPFAVGKYAVTFDEWDACVADGGCNGYKSDDNGWGRGKHPVINVNWDNAKAYASWLSRKTGKIYRLPSEAEREYVTRAGTTMQFWWGSSIRTTQANYHGEVYAYAGGSKRGYRRQTTAVDSFEPNAWGLYQVHGNVWEWTEDCWNDSNEGNPADGSARMIGDCSRRVVRGGSWHSYPQFLRSAGRGGMNAVIQSFDLGFRLARTLNQ